MMSLRITARHFCLVSACTLILPTASAQSQLIPRIEINQEFIENKTPGVDESGSVTRLSPGIQYIAEGGINSLLIDYSLDAISSSGLSQDDEINHNLRLRDSITHIPGLWTTDVTGNISQANISADGVQNLNPNITTDNTRELRTLGVNTALNGRVSETTRFQTSLGADYADYEDSEDSEGYNARFSLDNSRARKPFSWQFEIDSRLSQTDTEEQKIDTAHINLDYRVNNRVSTFLDVTGTDTNNDQLNETETLLGLNWTPGRNTSLRIAAGKRGDEDSYLLDASHKNRRMTLTANYEETVTTSREATLSSMSSDPTFSGTTQSISIIPVLEKRSTLSMLLTGKRSNLTFTIFQTERDQRNATKIEKTNGAKLGFNRKLSTRSSIDLILLSQKSKTTQDNDLTDIEVSYNKSLSKNSVYKITIRKTRQDSSDSANEYEQAVLGVLFTKSF